MYGRKVNSFTMTEKTVTKLSFTKTTLSLTSDPKGNKILWLSTDRNTYIF